MAERRSVLGGFVHFLWRLLVSVACLAWLVVVAVAVMAVVPAGRPGVPSRAALVIGPDGRLVEQLSGEPLQRAVARITGRGRPETLLKDVLDGIRMAKDDDRIQALYLDLDRFGGGGLSKLQAVGKALQEFRGAGKPVIAQASVMDQGRYYLAAQAAEVFMPPEGLFIIQGFGVYRLYFKEGLDRVGVDVHVYRHGRFKSAPEPLMRESMSAPAREANQAWLGALWQAYTADVAKGRGMSAEAFADFVDATDQRVEAAGGQMTKAALTAGLVDKLAHRDEVRQRLIDLVGEEKDGHTFHRVGLADYLHDRGGDRYGAHARGDLVAVVVARGDILEGDQPPGAIGGDSTSRLIRRARDDDHVKALVLRVDSPGGVVFAADRIHRELELMRQGGKPVVVSMSSVAASGGYEISVASDQILCSPTTLTGSIGVFSIIPTIQTPLKRYLGAEVDGVGTTPWAGALRTDRALDPRVGAVLDAYNTWLYDDFVGLVAKGRAMSTDDVDAIAQGRVWSGDDALRLGLVDRFGELDDAVAAAADLAHLGARYHVKYFEEELGFGRRLMIRLLGAVGRVLPSGALAGGWPDPEGLPADIGEAARLARLAADGPRAYRYAFLPVD